MSTEHPSGHGSQMRIEPVTVAGRTVWVERDTYGIVEVSDSREVIESDAEDRKAIYRYGAEGSRAAGHG